MWYAREGHHFDLLKFWDDLRPWRDYIVFLCADDPHSLQLSFAAVDEPKIIADCIGSAFDGALSRWRPDRGYGDLDAWYAMQPQLDSRVHVLTPWTVSAYPEAKVSIFNA
jgi:hypothetical protein